MESKVNKENNTKKKKSNTFILILAIFILGLGISFGGLLLAKKLQKPKEDKITTRTITYKYTATDKDILSLIGYNFNINAEELKKLNNLDSYMTKKGQKMDIPNVTIYEVEKNMTLEQIAKKFHTTIYSLKKANKLETNSLEGKKEILIPNRQVYVVKENDTLKEIANKFKVNEEYLQRYNYLTNNKLKKNQVLVIPEKNKLDDLLEYKDTVEEINNNIQIKDIGRKIFNKKEYLPFKKTVLGYELTLEEVEKLGYTDAKDYVYGCTNKDIVLIIDDTRETESQSIIPISGCRVDNHLYVDK